MHSKSSEQYQKNSKETDQILYGSPKKLWEVEKKPLRFFKLDTKKPMTHKIGIIGLEISKPSI